MSGLTLPLGVYSHTFGCAVTGGYVYRGSLYPAMTGAYVFGDYCSGRIFAVQANGPASQAVRSVADTGLLISSFGESGNGTIYVVDLHGSVYRLGGFGA